MECYGQLSYFFALWAPSDKLFTNFNTSETESPAAIFDTIADPTTAPSACRAISYAASGVFIPKPTTIGRSVLSLIRLISVPTSAAFAEPAPVTPVYGEADLSFHSQD